jgi:peptide/nickel transport system substrate-binding protein
MQPQPQLAESWEFSADGKTITVHLRKGVLFHSGRQLTSGDIKYNIAGAANPKTGTGQYADLAAWFTDVGRPDKYTAVMQMNDSQTAVFDLFEQLNITDHETMDSPAANTMPVGTGPFKFVEWVQGDHYTVAKNPNYWMSGRPYLDSVETRIPSDPQALIAQFEGGAVDAADSPMIRDITRYQKDPKYNVVLDPPNQTLGFKFNTTYAPVDNRQFRQALNYAIDRQRMSDVLLGLGAPLDLPWPPGSPANDEARARHYSFDLDKARTLLADSGVDLAATQLELAGQPSEPDLNVMAQIYQADLAKLGLNVKVNSYDTPTFQDQLNDRNYKGIATYRSNNVNMQPVGLLLRNGAGSSRTTTRGT